MKIETQMFLFLIVYFHKLNFKEINKSLKFAQLQKKVGNELKI